MARYRIGRSTENEILLDDRTVSRRHAEIEALGGDRYRLTDLGSSLGTFVLEGEEWRQIEDAEVESGTRLRFGEYETSVAEIVGSAADAGDGEAAPEPAAAREPQAPPPRQPAAGPGSGLDRNTKIILLAGGGGLVLLVIIVAVAVLVGGGDGTIGGASAGQLYEACVERNQGDEERCRCLADVAEETLNPEQREILLISMSRDGDDEMRARLISERLSSVSERLGAMRAMIRFQQEFASRCVQR